MTSAPMHSRQARLRPSGVDKSMATDRRPRHSALKAKPQLIRPRPVWRSTSGWTIDSILTTSAPSSESTPAVSGTTAAIPNSMTRMPSRSRPVSLTPVFGGAGRGDQAGKWPGPSPGASRRPAAGVTLKRKGARTAGAPGAPGMSRGPKAFRAWV